MRMNWFAAIKRLWSAGKRESGQEVLAIARKCGPAMDQLALRVFEQHGPKIMQSDNTFLVHAIWGVRQGASPDRTQELIHREFEATHKIVTRALGLTGLSEAQQYALDYLIRDLAITKLVYMAQKANSTPDRRNPSAGPGMDLASMDVIGSA